MKSGNKLFCIYRDVKASNVLLRWDLLLKQPVWFGLELLDILHQSSRESHSTSGDVESERSPEEVKLLEGSEACRSVRKIT
ncbi:hypothetical protein OIU84_030249 [Salix udensis]|uniref:Protein kinase domain-containing protein n=1 Tax=Salix udensis TaxID=889485 RepID=A0AAD6KB70_9ROSI|nr:hypothetical protein OIU84_030249 [Salix udensis]